MKLTGYRWCTLALILGLCALAATGCRRKSRRSTIINGSDIFTTDQFPGASVQANNVADDKRAFSVSGQDFLGSLQVVFNGDRGPAMATYLVNNPGPGQRYVHYYDGQTWTPPVAVGANDCDLTSAGPTATVAFLNTENHSSDFAQARNGDAIVFWTANDGASAAVGDGVNRNLYATYFHAQLAGEISANYGFELYAQRLSVEDDNVGGTGEDVSTIGLISDGLCGEARWANGQVFYHWGDDTTEIIAFWRQSSDNDPAAGYQDDEYWAYSRFDLGAAVTSDLPVLGGPATRGPILGFGASDTGVTSEETQVFPEFESYNNVLFFKVSADGDAGSAGGYVPSVTTAYGSLSSEDKITVQEVAFGLGTSTVNAPATLHSVLPSAAVGDTNQCNGTYAVDKGGFINSLYGGNPHDLYGSDEGLATLISFTFELTTDPNTTFGEITTDGRLRATEINEANGGLIAGGASFLDLENPLISDSTFVFDSRISRNGDYIWVGFMKKVDAGAAGPSAEDQTGVFASEFITTRIQDDGTFPVPPAISSTLSAPVQLNTIITLAGVGQNVAGFEFQYALGYRCGIQSDPDVMHIFFEHSDTTGDTVWDARLTADLDPTANCVPTTGVAVWEGFSHDGDMGDFGFPPQINHFDWKEFDSGEGGNIVTFYNQDIDATVATDFRMMAEKNGVAGGKVEIDSNTANRQIAHGQAYPYAATAPGTDIGVFDLASGDDSPDRPKPMDAVDIFFYESQVNETDGLPMVARTRRFTPGDLSVAFGDQFTPNAGTTLADPFFPGLPEASLTTNNIIGVDFDYQLPVAGNTVGLYFTQHSRLYYQENDGNGNNNDTAVTWANTDGVSNPFLVDDDNDEELQTFNGLFFRSCTCNKLDSSMVFWTKEYGSGSGGSLSQRLQVRVRDGNNN